MKKGLRTYIMLSALLTISGAIVASQHPASSVKPQPHQATQKKQTSQSPTLADIGKELIQDIEEVDQFIHNNIVPKIEEIAQEGEKILKEDGPTIAAVLKKVGINPPTQQQQQTIINDIEEAVETISKGDISTYNLVQKLEHMQVSKNNATNVVEAAAKK